MEYDKFMNGKNISSECLLERIECRRGAFFAIVSVSAAAKSGDLIHLPDAIHYPVSEINLLVQFPTPNERDAPPYFEGDKIVLGWPLTGARTLLVLGKIDATAVRA